MKKMSMLLGAGAILFTAFLFGGCSALFKSGEDSSSTDLHEPLVNISVEVKYFGAVEEEKLTVKAGKEFTVKASDVDDYVFWYWEKDGKIVSEEAEYTATATKAETYYAVFKPKADELVLIDVVCERDEFTEYWYKDIGVTGGGVKKKGEPIALRSNGELAVSWFTVKGERRRGPYIELTGEESVRVEAEFESVCQIEIEENPYCEIRLVSGTDYVEEGELISGTFLMNDGERLELSASVAEEYENDYALDQWRATRTGSLAYSFIGTYDEESGCEWSPTYELGISDNFVNIRISLTCEAENIASPHAVRIVSDDGSGATVVAPKKFALADEGEADRSYQALITPNADSYIQRVALYTSEEVVSCGSGQNFNDYYNGAYFDISEKGIGTEDAELRVYTVKRDSAAIVNVISDDDWFTYTPKPSGGYAPSISTKTYVVKKGEPQIFRSYYDYNLNEIYKCGYQFSHVEDENGNRIADTFMFEYAVNEDTDFYIRYIEKPIADEYFDYFLTDDGKGYEARLSPLNDYFYRWANFADELTIPSVYNGKPVVAIGDYGMGNYRKGVEEDWSTVNLYPVYKKLIVPASVKRIGVKAFANYAQTEIVFDENAEFEYISPDAFYSTNDSVKAVLTKTQLTGLVKQLHERYIGDGEGFEVRFLADEHFGDENELGHYEGFAEYICLKESVITDISAFELSLIYHEFAHHYQFAAMAGVGEETYETLAIQPTEAEVEAWSEPYDEEDYAAYWAHPMEASARAFALKWTGFDQG